MSAELLKKITDTGADVTENEPLCKHTTFKIGGPAKYFCTVTSEASLILLISVLKAENIRFFILGNGSNILADDNGFDGAIITLSGDFCKSELIDSDTIRCYSGVKLSSLCKLALENSLAGLEFAFGIPGTVGGAVYMNAGAYGGEMKNVVASVRYLDTDGNIKELDNDRLDFRYRHSIFSDSEKIILSADIKLCKAEKDDISAKMNDFMERRKSKQPLEYPSAGSVFKRPEGYFAGALIEQAGLKGYKVGGAQVSEKHSGFIINYNNATCDDVKKLVKHIQDTVMEKDGVMLECEIKTLV